MYFYIDGDNCPGTRTVGIKSLKASDTVKVFFAANNKYYASKENREALISQCKCKVEYITVTPGANTVDFAIAVHIAKDCESDVIGNIACIVSADRHFDIVRKQLNDLYKEILVKRVETVEEGWVRNYLLEVESLVALNNSLTQQFGTEKGAEVYNQLKRLFEEQRKKEAITIEAPSQVKKLTIINKLLKLRKAA